MNALTPNGIRIGACGHFRKELAAVLADERFAGTAALTFAPFCSHPQNRRVEWQQATLAGLEDEPTILAIGGCFLGSTKPLPQMSRSRIVYASQCLYFIAGESLVNHLLSAGAYLMIPAWLQSWRQMLSRWGFDRKTAREFFKDCSTKIVLLDTGVDPEAAFNLKECADYLDMPAEVVPVGLDYFRLFLLNEISESEKADTENDLKALKGRINQQDADNLMLLDLLEGLAQKKTEKEVIAGIFDLMSMFFAASVMEYLPNGEKAPAETAVRGGAEAPESFLRELREWMASSADPWALSADETGFYIRIGYEETLFGVLGVGGFTFPQYVKRYLARSKSIGRLCGIIIENIRLLRRIEKLADTDGLTGLFNRRRFYELALNEVGRMRRYGGVVSAIELDIDLFKSINDSYGHAAGDLVLKNLGACMLTRARGSDFCGRLGGEEFAIMLPETSAVQALVFAERLRKLIEAERIPWEGGAIRATVSLGVAQIDSSDAASLVSDAALLETLLRRCDQAMYTSKANGRNRCELYR